MLKSCVDVIFGLTLLMAISCTSRYNLLTYYNNYVEHKIL